MSQICETFNASIQYTFANDALFLPFLLRSESKSEHISALEYVYNIMWLELHTRIISDLLKIYLKILTHLTKDSHSLLLSYISLGNVGKVWLSRYKVHRKPMPQSINLTNVSRKEFENCRKFQNKSENSN